MLSVLQIWLLCIVGFLAIASIVFMVMFIVEISVVHSEKVKKVKIKKLKKDEKNKEEDVQISLDDMLENLEKQSQEGLIIEEATDNEEVLIVEDVAAENEEIVIEEVQEETTEEVVEAEEVQEETAEEVVEVEEIQEEPAEEIIVEEVVEKTEIEDAKNEIQETSEEVEELKIEDVAATLDEEDDDISDDDLLIYQQTEPEISIASGSVIDYKVRLDKLVVNKARLEKDLQKIQKFILKYERTDRRKNRNQKMLDRRAGELTNLNLVMYSVTDIKNVDEDKKIKQEELTAHIAELKASIQDAEEYLESNKEKYEHNVKMAKFLTQERTRYSEEIAELEILVKNEDEVNN